MRKIQYSVFTGLVVLGALVTQVQAAAPLQRIATVSIQEAMQTAELGKKAKAQLEKDFNAKKKQLQTEESALKKLTEEFKKQTLVMSDEARGKRQGELQERIVKFQELTARSQAEIQQKERELFQPIYTQMKGLIAEVAKQKEYTIVLDKSENGVVLYSQSEDDLTHAVVTAFDHANQGSKSKL